MCCELTFLVRHLTKTWLHKNTYHRNPQNTLPLPQYVMCHSHFLLLRMHIIVVSEIMLQAWRNSNFWNGKMIAHTVIAGYHKCQSYLTARQNKDWPQFEAVKLHSNQNKNKKSLTQTYCFVLYWKLWSSSASINQRLSQLNYRSPLHENPGLGPLGFLERKGRNKK